MDTIWTSPGFIQLSYTDTCVLLPDELGTSTSSVTGYPFCISLFSNVLQKLIQDPAIPLPKHYSSVLAWVYKQFSDKNPCGDLSLWSRLLSLKPTVISDASSHHNALASPNTAIITLTSLASETVQRIKGLYPGDCIGVPIGIALEMNGPPVFLIMLIYRPKQASSTFHVAVVNVSGVGLDYHAYQIEEKMKTKVVLRDALLVVSSVIPERILHSSFWIATFRLMLRPGQQNIHIFYTILLPYLNDKPLLNNWVTSTKNELSPDRILGGFWFSPQLSRSGSCITGVLACFFFFLSATSLFSIEELNFLTSVLFRWGCLLCAESDLRKLFDDRDNKLSINAISRDPAICFTSSPKIDLMSLDILEGVVRGFNLAVAFQLDAIQSTQKNTLDILNSKTLKIFKSLVDSLTFRLFNLKKLALSPSGLQYLGGGGAVPKKLKVNENSNTCFPIDNFVFPFFDRFRPDVQPNLNCLAGKTSPPPLIIPVDLTRVANVKVENLADVCTILRNAFETCVVLGNQRNLVEHSYCLRFQLIRHMILSIIPLPLPYSHPTRNTNCFWASQQATREIKTEMMRLLHGVARHFVTVCFSITNTRDIDAQRVLVMAAICVLLDAVLRCPTKEKDVAFPLGSHYSGTTCGPVFPFAFDVTFFSHQSDFFFLSDPLTNTVRTQILDYMYDLHKTITQPDQLLFSFETTKEITRADRKFLQQICLQYGFSYDSSSIPLYYTGDDPEFSDFIPEWVFLRDTVFYFKALMTPEGSQLPGLNRWKISDATLKWSYNTAKSQLVVRGFQMALECFGFVKSCDYDHPTQFGGGVLNKFLGWLGMATTRAPPSAADPTNLVDAQQRIETEDDVLYLKTLPTFSNKLSVSETEVLLQYLTVPYLRIPLVLQFFSDEKKIEALASNSDLKNVLLATLFEPSLWKPYGEGDWNDTVVREGEISEIPLKDRSALGTPLGILFNELVFAPGTVLAALELLLDVALEKDSGHVKSSALELILFVTHLTVTVTHFVSFLLWHDELRSSSENSCKKSSCGHASLARGLSFPSPHARVELQKVYRCLERRILNDVIPLFEDRALKAIEASQLHIACTIHSHIVYIFKYKFPNTKDQLSRFVASLLFVFTHHHFSLEAKSDTSKGSEKPLTGSSVSQVGGSLGVSEMDLFLILETHRLPLLEWFETYQEETNVILEKALSVTSFTRSIFQIRKWKELSFFGGKGRIVPCVDALAAETVQEQVQAALDSAQNQIVATPWSPSLLKEGVKNVTFDTVKSALQKVFLNAWGADYNQPEMMGVEKMGLYESWIRAVTRSVENTEFNFQIAKFSLMSHSLELLGCWVNDFSAFTSLFGRLEEKGRKFQSIVVSSTEYRYWCRLVGYQHDLQRWEPDDSCQPYILSTVPYSSATLTSSESWVSDILDPWLQHHLPHSQLFICRTNDEGMGEKIEHKQMFETPLKPRLYHSSKNFMRLMCLWSSPAVCRGSGDSEPTRKSVKELLVTKDPVTITVFNIVESGRSLHSIPCYTSDLHHSFCLPFSETDINKGQASCVTLECFPHRTLAVYRDIFPDTGLKQRYIPPEFLNGLIPGYFLNHYTFWQNVSDEHKTMNEASETSSFIYGYPNGWNAIDHENASVMSSPVVSENGHISLLKLSIHPTGECEELGHEIYRKNGAAVSVLQKLSISNAALNSAMEKKAKKDSEVLGSIYRDVYMSRLAHLHQVSEKPQGLGVQQLFLFNLRDVDSHSELAQFRDSLLRLEDLSCILVWAVASPSHPQKFYLHSIELPRLDLSFQKCYSDAEDSEYRYGEDQKGSISLGQDGQKRDVVKYPNRCLGNERFRCIQHAKLFLTNRIFDPSSLTVRLTSEISNSVILENDDGDLFLLVDVLAKPVIKVDSGGGLLSRHILGDTLNGIQGDHLASSYGLSRYEALKHAVAERVAPFYCVNRHNASWISNLGDSRYYIYSIHASRCFLFAPSPASALYLLLIRFLQKNYIEVCKAINGAYLFDSELDNEQQQIWTILNTLDSTYSSHPDAHATRLKLWLAASRYNCCCTSVDPHMSLSDRIRSVTCETFTKSFNSQRLFNFSKDTMLKKQNKLSTATEPPHVPFSLCSWNIESDIIGYVSKLPYVSGECRLSLVEEYEIMRKFGSLVEKSDVLFNRQVALQFLLRKEEKHKAVAQNLNDVDMSYDKLRLPQLPKMDTFMLEHDRTAVDGSCNPVEWINGLVGALVPFKRVEEPLSGPVACGFFLKILDRGPQLKLFTDFHLIYELITEGPYCSNVAVNPTESNHYWGTLLSRFLSPWEYRTPSQLMSFLRIILANPRLTALWPRIKEEKRHKISISLMLRSQESLQRFFKELHLLVRDQEEKKKIVWPPLEKPLSGAFLRKLCHQPSSANFDAHLSQRHFVTSFIRNTSCPCRGIKPFNLDIYDFSLFTLPSDAAKEPPVLTVQAIQNFACRPLEEFLDLQQLVGHAPAHDVHAQMDAETQTRLMAGLAAHRLAKISLGQQLYERFTSELSSYNEQLACETKVQLQCLPERRLLSILHSTEDLKMILGHLQTLEQHLKNGYIHDGHIIEVMLTYLERLSNFPISQRLNHQSMAELTLKEWAFVFYKLGNFEPFTFLGTLVELIISGTGLEELKFLNPFLSEEARTDLLSLTATLLLTVNRRNQLCQALRETLALQEKLNELLEHSKTHTVETPLPPHKIMSIKLNTMSLAEILSNTRHYAHVNDQNAMQYDPRLLAFEFAYNILLRKEQVTLIRSFVQAVKEKRSLCHQAVMGAGKTTVVAPLLVILLADQASLVVQVVPQSLLEFTKTIFRERFSAIIRKKVMTFSLSRYQSVTPQLVSAFIQAKEKKGVCLTTPTDIKSLFLKVISLCFFLNESSEMKDVLTVEKPLIHSTEYRKIRSVVNRVIKLSTSSHKESSRDSVSYEELRSLRRELDLLLRILELFQSSILLLDEIDLILHPLKSELHWPIGIKQPLGFTQEVRSDSVVELESGLRWKIPWHLMEPIFFVQYSVVSRRLSIPLGASSEVARFLRSFVREIAFGIKKNYLQRTPHLVLSDETYYHQRLKPHFARWMYLNLRGFRFQGLRADETIRLLCIPMQDMSDGNHDSILDFVMDAEKKLSETQLKMLNLSRQWINEFLPHIFQKVNRVGYGLMTKEEVQRCLAMNPSMPLSRQHLAVPFTGKDTPSATSEFAHPDIVIGLTIMAFRYTGLRYHDLINVMSYHLKELNEGIGDIQQRSSALLFATWVTAAGGALRGSQRHLKRQNEHGKLESVEERPLSLNVEAFFCKEDVFLSESENEKFSLSNVFPPIPPFKRPPDADKYGGLEISPEMDRVLFQKVWPLSVLGVKEEEYKEQLHFLYRLLWNEPLVIKALLFDVVFPLTLEHSSHQFSASGQELGSSILFPLRYGFSGTPNSLLPVELNESVYESGIYGKIIYLLTNPEIVSIDILSSEWTVDGFLTYVSEREDIHALIDTGALITGLSNFKVAEVLLKKGLKKLDGVVFLDEHDRQMILLRDQWKTIKLSECGLPWEKRFTFYDQVHTTGQDIKQHSTAKALLTLSKDMSFRDIAQGAWRMRGIGVGHTMVLCICPDVVSLIKKSPGCFSSFAKQEHDASTRLTLESRKLSCLNSTSNTFSQTNQETQNTETEQPNTVTTLTENVKEALISIMSWLIRRELGGELSQYRLLLNQNLSTVWRKNAFRNILREHSEIGSSPVKGVLLRSLEVFRDHVSYDIPSKISSSPSTLSNVLDLVKSHEELLETEDDHLVVKTIVQAIEDYDNLHKTSELMKDIDLKVNTLDSEMTVQQEEHQEQNEEEEQEEEHEEEEEKEFAGDVVAPSLNHMTRSNEPIHRWKLEDLSILPVPASSHNSTCYPKHPGELYHPVFTQMFKFSVPGRKLAKKIAALNFPAFIWASHNAVKMKQCHKLCHRLKNVLVIMEWIPDFQTENSVGTHQWSKLEKTDLFDQLEKIFQLFDRHANGTVPLDLCRYMFLHAGIHIQNDGVWEELKGKICEIVLNSRKLPNLAETSHRGTLPVGEFSRRLEHGDSKIIANRYCTTMLKTNSISLDPPVFNNQQPISENVSQELWAFQSSEMQPYFKKDLKSQNHLSPKHTFSSKVTDGFNAESLSTNKIVDGGKNLRTFDSMERQVERKMVLFLTYEEVKLVVKELGLFHNPSCSNSRHFVFISLQEAEAVRAALHKSLCVNQDSVVPDRHCGVALRHLAADFCLIDTLSRRWLTTEGEASPFVSWKTHQRELAHSCFRFLNSEARYSTNQVEQLIQCFIQNTCDERHCFFTQVLSCRRLSSVSKSPSLDRILLTTNAIPFVQLRVIALRLHYELNLRGFSLSDAFNAMDKDSCGAISCVQLYAGLRWLNIPLKSAEFLTIWNQILVSSVLNLCTEQDFIQAFTPLKSLCYDTKREKSLDDILSCWKNVDSYQHLIPPPEPRESREALFVLPTFKPVNVYSSEVIHFGRVEDYVTKEDILILSGVKDRKDGYLKYLETLDFKILERLKFRLVSHTALEKVWDGSIRGCVVDSSTDTTTDVIKHFTVWKPDQLESRYRSLTRRNRERVCLGHFLCEGVNCHKFLSSKLKRESPCLLVLEIEDPKGSYLTANAVLQKIIDILLPYPTSFKNIFCDGRGIVKGSASDRFVVWKPISPDEKLFTSIGYIVTDTNKPPPINSIRCVPLKWTQQALCIPFWKLPCVESGNASPCLSLSYTTGHLVMNSSLDRELKAKQFQLTKVESSSHGRVPKNTQDHSVTTYDDFLTGDIHTSSEDTNSSNDHYIPDLVNKFKTHTSKRWF